MEQGDWPPALIEFAGRSARAVNVHALLAVGVIAEGALPKVAAHLDAAGADVLAFTGFPKEIWRQIWPDNPQERLNPRRTDVAGIFPSHSQAAPEAKPPITTR